MSDHEEDDGWGAVPGEESHESEETLSPDERNDEEPDPPGFVPPVAPPPDPRQT
jgi:hypothetical protein